MSFVFIILMRILFAACMVFIIGYVFGGFSKKPVLTTFARVASILVIVLFISTNILFFRFGGGWRHGMYNNNHWCGYYQKDSTIGR